MAKTYTLKTKEKDGNTVYFFGNEAECIDFETGKMDGFDSLFDAVRDWSNREHNNDKNKKKELDIL